MDSSPGTDSRPAPPDTAPPDTAPPDTVPPDTVLPDNRAAHLLLVHGGCHGAWCWDEVLRGLRGAGVTASAFDLPGCGADHTPRAGITLDDTVTALLARIDALPAGPVRVVGHSIAGWLLPYAAARRDRVVEMVFVAAVTLARGERGIDMIPADRRPGYFDMAAASPDNSLMPPFEDLWQRFFPHLDGAAAREAYARLTPQAFGPYLGRATVGIEEVATPRRYLAPTEDLNFPPDVTGGFAAKAGVVPEPVEGDHCVMLTNPAQLVEALAAPGS